VKTQAVENEVVTQALEVDKPSTAISAGYVSLACGHHRCCL